MRDRAYLSRSANFHPHQLRAQHQVAAQIAMVDHILIAERIAKPPPPDQRRGIVYDPLCRHAIPESGSEAPI